MVVVVSYVRLFINVIAKLFIAVINVCKAFLLSIYQVTVYTHLISKDKVLNKYTKLLLKDAIAVHYKGAVFELNPRTLVLVKVAFLQEWLLFAGQKCIYFPCLA